MALAILFCSGCAQVGFGGTTCKNGVVEKHDRYVYATIFGDRHAEHCSPAMGHPVACVAPGVTVSPALSLQAALAVQYPDERPRYVGNGMYVKTVQGQNFIGTAGADGLIYYRPADSTM